VGEPVDDQHRARSRAARLAARSGCVSLSIGLESVNEESLDGVSKGFNLPQRYQRDLKAIRDKGIQVIALIMVGLDGDDAGTFQRTLES